MFGLTINAPQERYWGARAIYNIGNIDLLADRQSMTVLNSSAEQNSFVEWINGYALPWLRAEVKRINLASNDPQEIVLSQFKYELRASTNSSHGYLYIGAIEHKVVECEPYVNSASKVKERVVLIQDQKFVVDKGIVPVGTQGVINVNKIGPAKVVGYFNENYVDGLKLACLMVEALDPPSWWIDQTMRRDLQQAVKNGTIQLKRSSNDPSPTAVRQFKKNWKPKPFPLWPNDFKPAETPA